MARILRNLAYFAVGFFLVAAFMLGTINAHAAPARATLTAAVHKMHEPGASCSAVMIAPERALTAAHCLDMVSPVVIIDGHRYAVTEGYAASPRDIAILIVPGAPCPCVQVSGTPLVEGDWVAAVGYPYGLPLVVVTYGEFQGRLIFEEDGQEYLLVTALGAPGNSGGGIFNEHGELVGITSKGAQGHSLFAVEVISIPLDGIKVQYPRVE